MSRKWKVRIPLFILTIIMVTTQVFGGVEINPFSAYAACRKVAMTTKGYATWKHEQTIPVIVISWVIFSDGFNDLTCQAIGIGPFWTARSSMHTLVGCAKSLENEKINMCPEDYFGVSP